jgi:TolA-binding protein
MKKARRITVLVLAVIMLLSSCAFAAAPKASIVSPAANSVSSGDSLLVSVKVADKSSVKIFIFEEKEERTDSTTKEVKQYSVNVADFTEEKVKAVYTDYNAVLNTIKSQAAATDAAIVSKSGTEPAENTAAEASEETTATAIEAPAEVKAPVVPKQKYIDVEYAEPISFTASGELGFFTKQLTGVKPGLYRIQVDVVDGDKILESVCNFVAVKEKQAETKADIFETQQSGAMKYLSNLLKTIFK